MCLVSEFTSMETEMRDSQRKKVYTAEEILKPISAKFNSIEETRSYVDRVTMSHFYQHQWPAASWSIRVRDGRGTRIARGGRRGINLPLWARTEYVCLHEIAHCVVPDAKHNWQWAQVFLQLVEHFMGKQPAEILKQSFITHKVRFRAPQKRTPLSDERRAALAAQLKLARERRGLSAVYKAVDQAITRTQYFARAAKPQP